MSISVRQCRSIVGAVCHVPSRVQSSMSVRVEQTDRPSETWLGWTIDDSELNANTRFNDWMQHHRLSSATAESSQHCFITPRPSSSPILTTLIAQSIYLGSVFVFVLVIFLFTEFFSLWNSYIEGSTRAPFHLHLIIVRTSLVFAFTICNQSDNLPCSFFFFLQRYFSSKSSFPILLYELKSKIHI